MSFDPAQFEDITHSNKLIKAAQMEINSSFTGKLIELAVNAKFPDKKNLIMEDGEGNPFIVFTSGTLAFAVEDDKFEVGRTYQVTRVQDKMTKTGKPRTTFNIKRLKADGSVAEPAVSSLKPAGKSSK